MPKIDNDPAGTCAAFIQLVDDEQAIASEPWDKDAMTVIFGKGESQRAANARTQEREAARKQRLDDVRARLQAIMPDLLALSHASRAGNPAAVTRYLQTWKPSDAVEAKGTAMELAAIRLPGATTGVVKPKRARKDEANIKARAFLQANPNATVRELAADIGCSTGFVSQLPAWKAVQEQRDRGRQPKRAKVVSLTPKLQRTAGVEDASLAKLIDEQEADAEPSPLKDDPRRDGSPRRAKVYRKP